MASRIPESPVWLVTGCSAGFGRALAARVLEHGHPCVVTARNVSQVEAIAAPYPDRALVATLDVTDAASREHAIAAAEKRFGRIDILLNNAGWSYNSAIEEGEEVVVRAMFDVNVFGLAAMMRRVLPGMRARGYGHIVNFSSIGGLRAVFEKVARACKAHGKSMGVGGARGDRELQRYLLGLGVRYLTSGSDVGYLMNAAKADVEAIRAIRG